MAGRVEGKVAIVTGAAHGMGASHALSLAREGADVAVIDIAHDLSETPYHLGTEKEATSIVDQIKATGRRAIFVKCDVSNAKEVEAMVNKVVGEFGRIDVLVNNAAVCLYGMPIWEHTEKEWDQQIDVVLKGCYLCCKYVIPQMIKQGSGTIVNIGSSGVRKGGPSMAAYCAAKAGIHNFTYAIAADAAPYGINVNCVAPGTVRTPMVQQMFKPLVEKTGMTEDEMYDAWVSSSLLGKPIMEQDISNAVVFLASDEAKNVNGIVLPVDGGFVTDA